jgi:hypothetical protein
VRACFVDRLGVFERGGQKVSQLLDFVHKPANLVWTNGHSACGHRVELSGRQWRKPKLIV